MNLLKVNADRIVHEISSSIELDINFMNEEGIIIASTDKSRIGQVHAGAKRIIEEHLDELVVKEDDLEAGMREGANYPLIIGNDVVGVIGITGEWKRTARLGKVTQKMTQLLMTELSVKEHKSFEESQRNRFIMEWIESDPETVDKSFVRRGKQLQMDIVQPRRFMLVSVHVAGGQADSYESLWNVEQAEERIRSYVMRKDSTAVYMKSASTLLLGVGSRTDADMYQLALKLLEIARRQEGVEIDIGIDEFGNSYTAAKRSYEQALKALQSCLRMKDVSVRFYKEITLEIFADEVSVSTKKEFIMKLFPGFSLSEIVSALELIRTLYEQNGSIMEASQRLHMHKNTLQYKLKKIAERTGHDPRTFQSAPLFTIAQEFFYDISGDLPERMLL